MPLVATLTPEQLWARPGGVAAVGFHVAHLPGSLDRLLTYSRGAALSDDQLLVLAGERSIHANQPSAADLLQRFTSGFEGAIAYLRTVDERSLAISREVGRKRLPSTTLGLIFHAAEHSSRHAGQIVTLSAIVRAMS
ncbi:MAG: DinB family protein [Cytophagaceae bacterium]|nr:DinB family protein [Gemmatimonadaceae bacterium]